MDESASKCKYVCPDHNYLESWNDYNIKEGNYSIQQPLIRPLFNTRQAQESLLVWAGEAQRGDKESKVYYNFMRDLWEKYGFPSQTTYTSFEEYWNWSVHNGTSIAVNMPFESLGSAYDKVLFMRQIRVFIQKFRSTDSSGIQ